MSVDELIDALRGVIVHGAHYRGADEVRCAYDDRLLVPVGLISHEGQVVLVLEEPEERTTP